MSSGPKETKMTSLKDVKSKCPLSDIPAIEGKSETMSLQTLIAIAIVSLIGGTSGEDMFITLEKILKGECQKENSSNLPAFWNSLQGGLDQLSVSQLIKMLLHYIFVLDLDQDCYKIGHIYLNFNKKTLVAAQR